MLTADVTVAVNTTVPDTGTVGDGGVLTIAPGVAVSFAGSATVDASSTVLGAGSLAFVSSGIVDFGGAPLTTGAGSLIQISGTGSGTAVASVEHGGTLTLADTSSATVTGLLNNLSTGEVAVSAGASLTTGSLANASGGSVVVEGTLDGGAMDNSGTFNIKSGSDVDGTSLTNNGSGTLTVNGDVDLTGAFTNDGSAQIDSGDIAAASGSNGGTLRMNGGLVDVAGAFDNSGTTTMTSGEIEAASMANSGTLIVAGDAFVDIDTLTNGGTLELSTSAGTAVDGTVAASGMGGTINVAGTQTVSGSVTGTHTIDMTADPSFSAPSGSSMDTLNVGGDLSGTVTLEVDIAPGEAAASDVVAVTGSGAGASGTINFTNQTTGGLQNTPADILTAGGAAFDVSAWSLGTGVSATGPLVTDLVQNGSNIAYTTQVNPAIGGLAGGLSLAQSLITSVVNRPTSAFGGGLAVESGNNCGPGVWSRVAVGSSDIDGSSNNGASDTANSSSIDYQGLQVGGDVGCYQGAYNGWDIAIGGTLGLNTGEIVTTVPSSTTSDTASDFDQLFVGAYILAANGPLRMDLQFRGDETEYVLNNADLGLDDADYTTSSMTLSGSVSYAVPLNDQGLVVIPTGGLSLTRTKADAIIFEGDASTSTPSSTLTQGEYDTQVAFLGGTLAKTSINADGVSATTSFLTATYYEDLSDDLTSNYTIGTTSQDIVTTGDRSYGELSAGVNYVRILEEGGATAAKQMNLSVRADARIGADIDGYGLTANFRLQF